MVSEGIFYYHRGQTPTDICPMPKHSENPSVLFFRPALDVYKRQEQGGVSVADEKVTDIKTAYNADSFGADGLVVKRGKKKFVKVIVK